MPFTSLAAMTSKYWRLRVYRPLILFAWLRYCAHASFVKACFIRRQYHADVAVRWMRTLFMANSSSEIWNSGRWPALAGRTSTLTLASLFSPFYLRQLDMVIGVDIIRTERRHTYRHHPHCAIAFLDYIFEEFILIRWLINASLQSQKCYHQFHRLPLSMLLMAYLRKCQASIEVMYLSMPNAHYH